MEWIDYWKQEYGHKPQDMLVLFYWRGLRVNNKILYRQLQGMHCLLTGAMDSVESEIESEGIEQRDQMLSLFIQSRSGPLDLERKAELNAAVQQHLETYLNMIRCVQSIMKNGGITKETW